ncbi:hypothetical protein GCM10020000_15850 [Streptomyces olivoverticillatus]
MPSVIVSGSQLVASCTGCRLARYSYWVHSTGSPGPMPSRRATGALAGSSLEDASQVRAVSRAPLPSGGPCSPCRTCRGPYARPNSCPWRAPYPRISAAKGESTAPVERSSVPSGARSVTNTPPPELPLRITGGLQDADRAVDGLVAGLVGAFELGAGGDALAHGERALVDAPPKVVGDAQIHGPAVAHTGLPSPPGVPGFPHPDPTG